MSSVRSGFGRTRRTVNRSLHVTDDIRRAVHDTELTLIAVGTPFDGQKIDLGYVGTVAEELGKVLGDKDEYHVVVVKSQTTEPLVDSM